MFNMKDMMQQAQQMQFKLAEMQEKFKDIYVSGEAGGGLVKVEMSCAGKIKTLDIDPSLLKAEEKETTEDLILAAINNAGKAKDARIEKETEAMMGGMNLPPGMKLPF